MSDFTADFWSIYVAVLTLVGILACAAAAVDHGAQERSRASADNTTGHVWDEDLSEMNNPMPRWWMWLFVLTIVFGLRLPGGCTRAWAATRASWAGRTRGEYAAGVEQANAELAPLYAQFTGQADRGAGRRRRRAWPIGERLFMNNCAQCHGSDARGSKGFPNLTDGDWLHGGDARQDRRDHHARAAAADAADGRRGRLGRGREERRQLRAEPVGQPARLGRAQLGKSQVHRLRGLPRRRRQGQPGDGRAQPDRQHLAAWLGRAGDHRHGQQRQDQRDAGAGGQADRGADPRAGRLCLGPVEQGHAPAEAAGPSPCMQPAASARSSRSPRHRPRGATANRCTRRRRRSIRARCSGCFARWRWAFVWPDAAGVLRPALAASGASARRCCSTWARAASTSSGYVLYPQDFIYLTGAAGDQRPVAVPVHGGGRAGCGAASPARRRSTPRSSCGSSARSKATAARACGWTPRRVAARSWSASGSSTCSGSRWRCGPASPSSATSRRSATLGMEFLQLAWARGKWFWVLLLRLRHLRQRRLPARAGLQVHVPLCALPERDVRPATR